MSASRVMVLKCWSDRVEAVGAVAPVSGPTVVAMDERRPALPLAPPIAPADALDRVAYLLDRTLAPSPKVRAFLRAREAVVELGVAEVRRLVDDGRLQDVAGIGASTGAVITEAVRGEVPAYLVALEERSEVPVSPGGARYRAALRGDCHLHSHWSDGSSPIEVMAGTARDLGHEYMVLTDHSPRLTVAHGLDRERLTRQLDVIAGLNEELAPFRILTGIEVDILEDGALDQDEDLLARLDVVVASVHSKLRMDRESMTRRMVMAVASPHVDILGHCTGRQVSKAQVARVLEGRDAAEPPDFPERDTDTKRPPSGFDAEIVFAACARFDKAVEINCRPERQDPPDELLGMALDWGCKISIDTDAHAPGQLEWQRFGCDKAARHDIELDRIVNTWSAEALVDWAGSHPTG
jgi:putative hydrolase